jgi:mycothiol synthase
MQAELLRVGDVAIHAIDVRDQSDDFIVAMNEYSNAMRAESNPDDPPTPIEVARARAKAIPEFVEIFAFTALDPDGAVVGTAEIGYMRMEENQHLMEGGVSVRANRRRQGIGKALLRLICEAAEREGRTLIVGGTSERIPAGEAFAERIGAQPAQANHINRLVLAEVDRDLVRRWVDEGPRRAPGYSLVWVDGVFPDDMVDEILDVLHVMNDAPRDDVQMEDMHLTVEQYREMEKQMTVMGAEHRSLFVRHDASGQLVGLTDVTWLPAQPETINQGNTGVRPEHRGHALGKWLKAAMLQRILDERPDAIDVRTGNADSNDAMVGINRELGFKPFRATTTWQITTEQVRTYLDRT